MKMDLSKLPADLAKAALIDVKPAAATGGVSVSWFLAEVAAKRAPQPVIRRPRFTRWRVSDVAAYWTKLAEAPKDPGQADRLLARAKMASTAARAPTAVAKAKATKGARIATRLAPTALKGVA